MAGYTDTRQQKLLLGQTGVLSAHLEGRIAHGAHMNSKATVNECIRPEVEAALAEFQPLAPEALFAAVVGRLGAEGLSAERFAGDAESQMLAFVRDTLLPQLRSLGRRGRDAWELLCDPSTPLHLGRLLSLVIVISIALGVQTLDVSTVVGLILSCVTLRSRHGTSIEGPP